MNQFVGNHHLIQSAAYPLSNQNRKRNFSPSSKINFLQPETLETKMGSSPSPQAWKTE